METLQHTLIGVWNDAKGVKTYAVALAAIIYGIHVKDAQIVLFGLGLAGVRHGISTEIARVAVSADPINAVETAAAAVTSSQVVNAVAQTVEQPQPADQQPQP